VSRLEFSNRVIINLSMAAAVALGLNAAILAPLAFLGLVLTAELGVRPYASDAADTLLLICGSIVTIAILTGLVLNLTPWGLTRYTWAVTWIIVSSAVLIWRREIAVPTRIRMPRISRISPVAAWFVAAAAVLLVSFLIVAAGVRIWDQKPVLAFSLVTTNSHSIVVQVSATSMTGNYQILAASSSRRAHSYRGPRMNVRAGSKSETLNESVPVNVPGRWTIYLNSLSGDKLTRELIIDVP